MEKKTEFSKSEMKENFEWKTYLPTFSTDSYIRLTIL